MSTERNFEHIQYFLTGVTTNSTIEIYWSQPPPSFWSKIINPNRTTEPEVAEAAYSGMTLTPAPLSVKKEEKENQNLIGVGWVRFTRNSELIIGQMHHDTYFQGMPLSILNELACAIWNTIIGAN